ncbi:MAG: preprotein translocase subunit YajC [Armatimonadota bacterium]|jgi:preprotein translocase subunit YajC
MMHLQLAALTQQQMAWAIVLLGYFVILILFYIFAIKPRRDAMRRHKELVEGLSEGDRIVTAGGMYGRVVSVKEKTCVVEVAKGTQITIQRAAIRARQEDSA